MVRYTLIFVANLTMRRSKMIERQKRFAAHYAETGNGAEAARRAGYSEVAARQTAYKLRQKDSIKQAVEREQWFSDHDSRSAKRKATDLLIETFHKADNATDMRKAVDALCKLHRLV
jgi:phage terminase small subunit